jgi:type I restriction enzyme S subunit
MTTAWPEVSLGEVALINPRLSSTLDYDEKVSFIPMAAVDAITGTVDSGKILTYGELSTGLTPFESGDVLVAKITPCFENGKIAQARTHTRIAFGSTEFHIVRARPAAADQRYLFHFLRQGWIRRAGERRMIGSAGQRRVPEAFLREIPIPLPPVQEQRRIAEMLDSVGGLRAKRGKSIALLDFLTESVFLDMFGTSSTPPITVNPKVSKHPEGWSWQPLTQVARLATGHTPDREVADYWNGDIPWISLTEIRRLDGTIADDTHLRVTQAGIDNSSSVLLPAGTVCLSRTASIGFVTVMGRPMATSQDFVNWVCGDQLRPLYLMHALLRSRTQLRALSTGSTHKTIYMRVAEQFRVLVPPVPLQDEFVRRVTSLSRHRHRADLSAAYLDELFDSLQEGAFQGKL